MKCSPRLPHLLAVQVANERFTLLSQLDSPIVELLEVVRRIEKPVAEIATGKMAAPFTQLSNMVLSHASEEGASDAKPAAASSTIDAVPATMVFKAIRVGIGSPESGPTHYVDAGRSGKAFRHLASSYAVSRTPLLPSAAIAT